MVRVDSRYFDLGQICGSGQCFRMEEMGRGRYCVIAHGKYLEACQKEGEVRLYCSQNAFDTVWKAYFDLGRDYGDVIAQVDPEDGYLVQAAQAGQGIRILRQDLWEMVVTFIISQQNNIKRIRRCVRLLCERYGKCRKGRGGVAFYDFPSVRALSKATQEELMECNLGYRARYIAKTAQAIWQKEVDLDLVARMGYEEARSELMKLPGVGGKVADCICLFGLHHLDAFPVDTHILKVLAGRYPSGFPFERYAGIAGILQQYVFYYDLLGGEERGQKDGDVG